MADEHDPTPRRHARAHEPPHRRADAPTAEEQDGFFDGEGVRPVADEPAPDRPPGQPPTSIELEADDHPETDPAADEPRRVAARDWAVETAPDTEPVRDRLLLRGVDLAARLVTAWRNVRRASLRETLDRVASRHIGPFVRQREEAYADYRTHHVQARIDRDWDVQLAAGALITGVVCVVGSLAGVLGGTLLLGLSWLQGGLVGVILAAWIVGGGYYWYTLGKVRIRTYQRRREIEKLLPQAVAYMFSHSQGQQTVPEIIENLAHEQDTYGAISEEFGIVHKEVAIFESDLRNALRKARETTPSENLSTFFDELINVIDTSGELTTFLREKTEEYQSRSLIEEDRFIGRLSLAAFGYTFAGVFVPVMGIIALVFLSMMGVEVLWLGLVLAWGYIPVLSAGTWLAVRILAVDDMSTTPTLSTSYDGASIDSISQRLAGNGDGEDGDHPTPVSGDGGRHHHIRNPRWIESRTDGHDAPLSDREQRSLSALGRALTVVGARRALDNVWTTLNRQPLYTFVASVPLACGIVIAALLLGVAAPPVPGRLDRPVWDTTVTLVVPLVVVLGPLWYFSRRHRRHDKAVREELPNMLRKLSSATEAGTPFVESIKTVGETAEADLSTELRLMRNELSTFFANLEDSLVRMANRVRNPRLTRVTTLLVEANTSSGNVQDILAVAARDAENSKRLDEKRFSKMERQMFVIVMGVGSFLIIAGAFQFFLLPHIVEALAFTGEIDPDRLSFFPTIDEAMFTVVMFQTAVSIGLCSGLVAGKFGYDDARAGAGWALLQVLGASVVFWGAAIVVG